MSIYNTGTVAVAAGDATVVGTGTGWAISLVAGGMFSCLGMAVPIASVTDDTHLELAYPWPGTTETGEAYAIALETALAADTVSLTTKLASVLARLIQSGALTIDPGILYTFDIGTTDSDQGPGKIWFDNANLGSATVMYLSKTSAKGSDVSVFLASLDDSTSTVKGRAIVSHTLSGLQSAFKLGAVTDATNYVKVAISNPSGETAFDESAPISFQFAPTGDATTLDLLSMGVDDETDIASAATLNLTSGTPKTRRRVTGTTTITAITAGANKLYILRFAGVLTLTHNGTSLILPGGLNITTAAGDVAIIVTDASGNSRCIHYQRANGMPLRYAEGTFTPGISFGGATTGITYSGTPSGHYVVVGNLVFITGQIVLTSKGSATGIARLTGLPFAIGSSGNRGAGTIGFFNPATSLNTQPVLGWDGGASTMFFRQGAGSGTTDLTNTNFNNTTEIQFSAVYSRA